MLAIKKMTAKERAEFFQQVAEMDAMDATVEQSDPPSPTPCRNRIVLAFHISINGVALFNKSSAMSGMVKFYFFCVKKSLPPTI